MRFALGLVWLLLSALPLRAEVRALLIGASAYDSSIGIPSLRGPRNDVALLRDVLAGRGVTDIRIVADGIEGAGRPVRAGILGAFARLAEDSGPGDLVFIAMSGHGTRQPDLDGDETDGLDEVFLPGDTGRAESGARVIPNAITDDEIGAAVRAIRATGADVFLTMDNCHSGTGLRAASPNVADRVVDPKLLGIDVGETRAAAAGGVDRAGEADVPGQVVAFYAARSSEVAREVNMTPGAADDSGWYGLFTAKLAARLQTAEGITYRQLFQAVLSDLNETGAPGGGLLQTPSWEGGLIDATVLGGRETTGVRQFAVSGDEVKAGLVHGFGAGTLMALVADATAGPEAALALAQIEEAEATVAYLRPVGEDCVPQSAALCPAAGALPAEARFARLVARPADTALRLAAPVEMAGAAPLAADDPLAVALAEAVAEVNAGGAARIEAGDDDWTVAVASDGAALWFGRRVRLGETPVGLSWRPSDEVPLASVLTRVAQAERFAALLSAASEGGSPLNPSPVEVAAEIAAAARDDLDPPGAGGNPARECRRALRGAGAPHALDLAGAPELKQCDMVSFSAQGGTPGARDVNRVHIDSRYCIHADHARVEDFHGAMPLGDPMIMCSDCPDGYAAGDERLFVIVTEAEENTDQLNLEGLVENCGGDGAAPTRGVAQAEAIDFLSAIGRRPDTRAAFGTLLISNVWVQEYRWQVLPKQELFARPPEQAGAND